MEQLRDIVIILSESELDDSKKPYSSSFVLRYDFQGTIVDLKKLIDANPHLFIEGGQMSNEE